MTFINIFLFSGFIITFGMRCNMGMAKLRTEHGVSIKYTIVIYFSLLISVERIFYQKQQVRKIMK